MSLVAVVQFSLATATISQALPQAPWPAPCGPHKSELSFRHALWWHVDLAVGLELAGEDGEKGHTADIGVAIVLNLSQKGLVLHLFCLLQGIV